MHHKRHSMETAMPSPEPRQPPFRADTARSIVLSAGLYWSIRDNFTTPSPDSAPAFSVTDIRLVNDDGSESAPMLHIFARAFIEQIEAQAAESQADDRRPMA